MSTNSNQYDYNRFRRARFMRTPVDGQAAKIITEAGLTWLRTNKETVNALNVYPVPDGDTGTNMVITMQKAIEEIADNPERNIGRMMHAFAKGAFMNGTGNSGVILSQLWRGFARALDDQEVLDAPSFVNAFVEARDTAYRGIKSPVEGTILTVAKDIAAAAEAALEETDHPIVILEKVVEAADESVQRTPDLLPVLKAAGVVDAGGKGLFYILEGMLRFIYGLSLETAPAAVKPLAAMQLENVLEMVEEGQDYEVMIDFRPKGPLDIEAFYAKLGEMGTSIEVGEGEGMFRVHIHVPTENRYMPIDHAMSLGTVTKVGIENLVAQMEDIRASRGGAKLKLQPVEPGSLAVVAVAPGSGIAQIFAGLGVAGVIEGGQTMNPSTQAIINTFEDLPTDKILILPNNKNIILAAQSAAELTVKNVKVIPTRTVPQGLAAMMSYVPDGDLDSVADNMVTAIDDVQTGEITTAIRSVEVDGVQVQEGQIIVMLDSQGSRKLVCAAHTLEEAVLDLLAKSEAADYELITIFYGEDVPRNEVNRIVDLIRKEYQDQEVEVQEGGQPHYQFIISIE